MVQIRSAVESDHERILSCILRDPLGWVDADTYRHYLVSGSYGFDRIWLAVEGGHVLAAAVWYVAGSNHPPVLDCLWVDPNAGERAALGATVIRAADFDRSEYHLSLKADWRDDPAICREVEWRRLSAETAGLRQEIERLRYEWTPASGIPLTPSRLICFPEVDDTPFLHAFRRVTATTLDRLLADEVRSMGPEAHARATLDLYRGMRGDRSWWRLAALPSGEIAGFVIPSANEDGHIIGYLGVVPESRGRGYSGDLLAEATRILAECGAQRIRADTDTGNAPMRSAFERTRYRNFGIRLIMSRSG